METEHITSAGIRSLTLMLANIQHVTFVSLDVIHHQSRKQRTRCSTLDLPHLVFVDYVESEAKEVAVRQSSWNRHCCVFLHRRSMQTLPAQGKCAFRTEQIRSMVLDTFDVLRATNDVLVFESSKTHTAPPQPAVALKLWVVIQLAGAFRTFSNTHQNPNLLRTRCRQVCRSTLLIVRDQCRH